MALREGKHAAAAYADKARFRASNLRCKYCFYADITENREVGSYGMMEECTHETLVRRAFEYAEGECVFAFQAGNPR